MCKTPRQELRPLTPLSMAMLLVMLICCASAQAHRLAPSRLLIEEQEPERYEILWRAPKQSAMPSEPILPATCQLEGAPPAHEWANGGVELRWRVNCPGGLIGTTITASNLERGYNTSLLEIVLIDGRRLSGLLNATQPRFIVPERQTRAQIAFDYLALGITHILSGIDHLLFLLALLLLIAPGLRTLILTISAFTLGHSATLSAAALGLIRYSQELMELGIALSVLILAIEASRKKKTWRTRRSALAALLFGLLHGMGFAGALAETGLPKEQTLLALLFFNGGVELGQLAFIVPIALALAISKRLTVTLQTRHLARLSCIYLIGALATMWTLERAVLLIS